MSSVQMDILKNGGDIKAILDYMQTLNTKIDQVINKRKTNKKKSNDDSIDETEDAIGQTVHKTAEKKKNAIEANAISIFTEEDVIELDNGPTVDAVWFTYSPTPQEGERVQKTQNPMLSIPRTKLLEILTKLTKKSRILTIPSKDYEMILNYHTNYDTTANEWEIEAKD
jgi:hypothetical protein